MTNIWNHTVTSKKLLKLFELILYAFAQNPVSLVRAEVWQKYRPCFGAHSVYFLPLKINGNLHLTKTELTMANWSHVAEF